jgi:hypothetical protein
MKADRRDIKPEEIAAFRRERRSVLGSKLGPERWSDVPDEVLVKSMAFSWWLLHHRIAKLGHAVRKALRRARDTGREGA